MDDVIADFIPALLRWRIETYGGSFNKEGLKSYYLQEALGVPLKEARDIVTSFLLNHSLCIPPMTKSQESIRELQKQHNLHIITSRQPEVEQATYQWLDRNFPGMFQSVSFSANHYIILPAHRKLKSALCGELGVEYLIEDSPEYAVQCANTEIPVLLFNQPWNQDCKHSMITRVENWDDITRFFGT